MEHSHVRVKDGHYRRDAVMHHRSPVRVLPGEEMHTLCAVTPRLQPVYSLATDVPPFL